MAGNEKLSTVLLQFKVDKGSLNSVVSGTNQVENRLEQLSDTAQSIGKNARSSFETASTATSGLSKRLEEAAREAESLDKKLERIRSNARGLSAETSSGLGNLRASVSGGRGNAPSAVDRADASDTTFGRISSVASAFDNGSELSNLAGLVSDVSAGFRELPEVLEKTGLSATQLTAGLGAAAAVTVAFAVVIDQYNKTIAKGQAALTASVAGQEAFQDARQNLTEAEVRARIQELEATRQLAQESANLYRGAVENQTNSADLGTRALARLGNAFNAFAPVTDALKAAETEAAAATAEIAALQAGLETGAFSVQTLREQEEQLAASRLQSFQNNLQLETQIANLSTQSSQALEGELESNRRRIQVINNNIGALRELAATDENAQRQLEALNTELANLERINQEVTSGILAQARAREQQAEAERNSARARDEAKRASEQASVAIERTEGQIADARKSAAKQAADFAKQQAKEQIDFAKRQADSERRYLKARSEILKDLAEGNNEEIAKVNADYQKDALKREQDYQRERAKIETDARIAISEAASTLDSLGLLRAQQAREQQLQEADQKFAEETALAQQAKQERLNELNDELAKQRAVLTQKLADLDASYQEERARTIAENEERRKQAILEQAIRAREAQQQLAVLNNQIQREKGIRIQAANDAEAITKFAVAKVNAQLSRISLPNSGSSSSSGSGRASGGAGGGGSNGGGVTGRTIAQYAAGGVPPVGTPVLWQEPKNGRGGEMAIFNQPARIYSASDTNAILGGGVNVGSLTVQVTGSANMDSAQLQSVVYEGVVKALRAAQRAS